MQESNKKSPAPEAAGTRLKVANQNKETSHKNYITKYLHHGSENAVLMRDLAKLAGMNEREVRKLVDEARRGGTVILSGTTGYFFPSENEAQKRNELKDWLTVKERRAESNRISCLSAKSLLNELEAKSSE